MTKIISYTGRPLMMTTLAGIIASQLQAEIDQLGRATLAVPGGTTPGPLFDALCKSSIDWPKITILLTDERWVPETSPRSNIALIRGRLLQSSAAAASFIGFDAIEPTPQLGIERLTPLVTTALPLTVCLLGMGEDLHTASLFPGAEGLNQALAKDAPPLMAMGSSDPNEARITLTAPVLQGAKHVHILLAGAAKRAALDKATQPGPVIQAPVRIILGRADVHIAD